MEIPTVHAEDLIRMMPIITMRMSVGVEGSIEGSV